MWLTHGTVGRSLTGEITPDSHKKAFYEPLNSCGENGQECSKNNEQEAMGTTWEK